MKPATALPTVCLVAAALWVAPSGAEDRPAPSSDWSVSLGIISFSAPGYLGDDDARTALVPSLDVSYRERVFLSSTEGLGANLVREGGWRAGPILAYHPGRAEDGSQPYFVGDDDTDDLRGLGDVDPTAELGAFVEYTAGPLVSSVTLRRGLDGHGGLVGEAAVRWTGGASVAARPFAYVIGPELVVGDKDYIGAFFDVDAAQSAASGLAAHDADGGIVSYGLRGSIVVPLGGGVSLIGFGAYDVLGEEPGDSSLVSARGSDEQGAIGASVSVSF